jgi:hypothetical protein
MAAENLHSPGQDPGFGVSVKPGLAHRPIYARLGQRFVVMAVAAKKKDFDRALAAAEDRLRRRR